MIKSSQSFEIARFFKIFKNDIILCNQTSNYLKIILFFAIR